MTSDVSGLAEKVKSRWKDDISKLRNRWPAEQLTLDELINRTYVKLTDGTVHDMDPYEVRRLISIVPPYFRPFMRVPLLVSYVRNQDGTSRYLVMGDRWQRRLAELMVREEYSADGIGELSVDEFVYLLKGFRSLVFVSLGIA